MPDPIEAGTLDELERLRKERDAWKCAHDNQVRMRRAIIELVDAEAATGLGPTALEAIRAHRSTLLPKSPP